MNLTPAELELIKAGMNLGGLFIIFVMMLFFGYRLVLRFGSKFFSFGAAFIAAQEKQANAMSEMKDSFNGYATRDNNEHQEMIVTLHVLAQNTETLTKEVRKLKDGDDNTNSRFNPKKQNPGTDPAGSCAGASELS